MIADTGDTFFPYNVVFVLEAFIQQIDPDIQFFRRKLNVNDPDQSCAIVPASQDYRPDSLELGKYEATVQIYSIMIQTLIIDTDEERGLRVHSLYAKLVREMLARSGPLQVALRNLQTTDSWGVLESSTQWRTGQQAFHNNQVEGTFRYLSTLEFNLETQIR